MKEAVAWVALLSCGHTAGDVPPVSEDPEPFVPRQTWPAQPYQTPAPKPKRPEFIYAPEVGAILLCAKGECQSEGRVVRGVVLNQDEPLPSLEARRAGAWPPEPPVAPALPPGD